MTATDNFRPLPFLGNAHLQTILSLWVTGGPLGGAAERIVTLPDGDRLVLHENTPSGWRHGGPIAVLLHGLTGSHASSSVVRLARVLLARRVKVVRVDLRGAGRGATLARGFYTAGCSDDVRAVLRAVHDSNPDSPLWLAGVSLGGNVALKLAGEMADHPAPGLARVAAVAPPIDLHACTALLRRTRNRVYEAHFIAELFRDARRRRKLFGVEIPRFPRRLTLQDFDDRYTAPLSGFSGAAEYYLRSSSAPLIPRIQIPTLILAARDDPFVAVEPIEQLRAAAHVEVRITRRGGHVGYLGRDGAGGLCWAERLVADWLNSNGSPNRHDASVVNGLKPVSP